LELRVWRPTDVIVVARNVPIFPIKALQSASNRCDISETNVCLVIHPFRKILCPIGTFKDGFRIQQGHGRPVEVQVLMSPLNRSTLDMKIFRLVCDEVTRAPQDHKWSKRTAVRSYLRHAQIRPEKYWRQKDKVKLGRKLSEKWAVRPICSTVPPRIWQKYFLKSEYKIRGERHTGQDHVTANNFSAEASFADAILKFVPVKDDRVLPEALVSILLGTGAWSEIDFEQGPPDRRLKDCSPEDPPLTMPPPVQQRKPLPPRLLNRDGHPVHLGADRITVYCGLQVSRQKSVTARIYQAFPEVVQQQARGDETVFWDGRCGPTHGPQCPACRWLEDRLVE